jgi:hypothetical protein
MKPNWITLGRTSGTEGVETVNISAMGNMGEERTSQIVAKTANGVQATLNIAQAGPPIVGAVRIYGDLAPTILGVYFADSYGISYPQMTYGVSGKSKVTVFSAEFNIDAKYIHDVVNYLADTYPDDDWDKNNPRLVIRWTTPVGQCMEVYAPTIPETGRISFVPSNFPATDLAEAEGSEIALSVCNGGETIPVDLYRIYFSDM